ncbi:uncharacterized protein LOC134816677 isoform X2 [Bolinopsis microptera]|uniref:uncharacterized protein LOC134816677 isoform X2 n=1 Tax=Bolinopsis microptera TaxID=2820187 RepID=UPI00307A1C99
MSEAHQILRRELKEIWKGLPINYKTCSKVLKRDSVFCDYFNAFLSLPAFARPLYYDRKTESLLEVYRDCKVPVVGITIQAPVPVGEVQELLLVWLLKYRLPLFLRTTLYVEYQLCKQLLRVSGAVPDRPDSDEELTESETEEGSESEIVIKERHVLDIAGLDRSSQMSTAEGLSTPLIEVPQSPAPSSTVHTPILEDSDHITHTPHSIDQDRDLIAMSSTTIQLEGGDSSEYDRTVGSCTAVDTVTESIQGSGVFTDSVRLPDINTGPVTGQNYTPMEGAHPPRAEGQTDGALTADIPGGDTTMFSSSPGGVSAPPPPTILPDIFSSSITDMLPDSQSDIASPHVWQRLYNRRNKVRDHPSSTPSPTPDDTFNEDFPDISISKQDRKVLLGSVGGMDGFREFLSRTAGEHLLNLWLDITQMEAAFEKMEEKELKVDMIRDLQDKYRTRLSSSAKERLFKREFTSLNKLKCQVLRKLQFYWLPRYFQMKLQNCRENGKLKLDLDEEQLKLPFLPTVLVSRSYPLQLSNLTTVINDTVNWVEMFKEHDQRIISGKLRNVSASIVSSKKDHFIFGIRSDKNAGGPFKGWLARHGNTEMINILSFCEEVTQYRVMEERKADRGILKRAGWRIWHNFMAPGAPHSVGLGPAVTTDIRIALLTTKDYVSYSVFDIAKGNVTLFLKRAWKEYIQEDYEVYLESRPDIMEQIKQLTETRIRQMQGQRTNQHRRRYRTHKHKKGGKKKKIHTVFDSESEEELEEEDYTNMQIPVLEDALTNRPAMDKFSSWADRSLNGEKLLMYTLWKDLKSYFEINKQSNKHLRSLQAEHIHRTHFLMKDKKPYNFPQDLSSRMSREQTARPTSPLLTKTMSFCGGTVEKVFEEFVQTLPLAQAALRRRNTSDDMNSSISQQSFAIGGGGRRRGRGTKSKKVPGRATPTKELYHRLLNLLMSVTGTWPEELLLFEKYLAEHGPDDGYPLIVNDLHFWVEVQRYKDMHHTDTDHDFIFRKLEAIIDCYLDPQIPTEPPPEKPVNLSPTASPTPSMVSKGQSSNPESPVQSKIDITSTTEKQKKLPWAQRKQVDLTVDIGQKISHRLSTPGGHMDKDMSHYDEAQKMVLKELVPFYAGFANQQDNKSSRLSQCKVCTKPIQPLQPPVLKQVQCHTVNRKWVGSPSSDTVLVFPLPTAASANKTKHLLSHKEHFTFTLEHGVTWTKHVDDDMISAANSEDGMPAGRSDPSKVRAR